MKSYPIAVLLILMLFFSVQAVFAGTTGKLMGTVKDASTGDPLIGANVVLEGTGMGASTDVDGYFVIINVPPGAYDMSVHYIGYASTTIENVKVSVDRTTTRDVKLSPQVLEGETVVVQAERPPIEMDRTHSSSVVSSETVESMPVTELEEVIELQAGVVSSNGELHFRGGRAREISYVVDGVPVTNSFSQSGGSLVEVDNNMIAELEVISGTFNAEYGQAQSGVVNIVTKRPASKFRTNINAYTGDWWSTKDDIYLGVQNYNPVADANVEVGVTGPIIPNKLGFVVNARVHHFESLNWYQRRFNSTDGWKIAAYREWAQWQDLTTGTVIPIPDSLATGDGEEGPLNTSNYGSFQAKLVYSFSPQVSLTYTAFGAYQKTEGPYDPNSTGGELYYQFAPDNFRTSKNWSYSQFLRFQHSPSDNFFYNIALSYQREDSDYYFRKDNKIARYPGDSGIQLFTAASTGVDFGSSYSLGTTGGFYSSAPGRGYNDQYMIQGDFNWQMDRYNFIKTGFSV
ncbi:MAG: carboxypeptidase-like regulatory domain-containing protein, partial [Calditrichia bacterium]